MNLGAYQREQDVRRSKSPTCANIDDLVARVDSTDLGPSDTLAPLIRRYPKVTHPYTLLTRVRFEREMRIVGERGKRIAGFGTSVFVELTDGRYVTIARSALSRLLAEKIGADTEMIFGDEIPALATIRRLRGSES